MTIFLFVLDTSSSMNQRAMFTTSSRMPLIDVAKQAVERILKQRSTKAESRSDRYMLMTLEEPPYNIKSGWKENLDHFKNELKNLKPHGTTSLSAGLKNAFDYLNLNRLSTTLDNYGNGRLIHFHEFAFIITITDGSKYSSLSNATMDLQFPQSNTRQVTANSQDLTLEPFRWDQKLFSLVLKMPAIEMPNSCKEEITPLDNMCLQTGGRSYSITNRNTYYQSIDNLVQKFQNGVMIRFLKHDPPTPALPWMDVTNFVHVRNRTGYSFGNWPIPEGFWVDQTTPNIQHRTAHPIFRMTCIDSAPSFVENLPFDKFELESSPLTKFIIGRNLPNAAWQLYVANSQRGSDLGQPFGYLKSSTQNTSIVNMFILPYNYPLLFTLLEELLKSPTPGKPTREWRAKFDGYLRSIPSYYMTHLKKALGKMGAPNLIPDGMDIPNPHIINTHKKLKHAARLEQERMATTVGKPRPAHDCTPVLACVRPRNYISLGETVSNPNASKVFADVELPDPFQKNICLNFKPKRKTTIRRNEFYRSLLDIPSDELLQQCTLLENILNSKRPLENYCDLLEKEVIHNMSISKMGDYQEAIKNKLLPLREIDPISSVRQHTFGNPFKNKKNIADIDEVNEHMDDGPADGQNNNMNNGGMSPVGNGNGLKAKKRPGEMIPLEPRVKRKNSAYFRDNSISDILSGVNKADLRANSPYHQKLPPLSPVPPSMMLNGQQSFSISTFDGQRFGEPAMTFGAPMPGALSPSGDNLHPSPMFPVSGQHVVNGDRVPGSGTGLLSDFQNFSNQKRQNSVPPHHFHQQSPYPQQNSNTNHLKPGSMVNGNLNSLNNHHKPRYESPFSKNGHYVETAYLLDYYARRNFRNEEFNIKARCVSMCRSGPEDHHDLLSFLASMDDNGGFKHYLLLEVVSAALKFRRMSVVRALLNDYYFSEEMKKIVQVNKINVTS